MRKLMLATIAICTLTGCVTASHVVTGKARPASSEYQVAVYPSLPDKAEIIGTLTIHNHSGYSHIYGNQEEHVFREEAAKIGANGIVIGDSTLHLFRYYEVNAIAIYVPESK